MSSSRVITLKSIGVVRTKPKSKHEEEKWKTSVSKILIYEEFTEALKGLSDFSHIYVIFLMHRVSSEQRKLLQVHPRGEESLPLVGVFATRSPLRPNPIGLTLVELISVKGNVLTVRGLDAFDGTPVLDIKPYSFSEMVKEAKFPEWVKILQGKEKAI